MSWMSGWMKLGAMRTPGMVGAVALLFAFVLLVLETRALIARGRGERGGAAAALLRLCACALILWVLLGGRVRITRVETRKPVVRILLDDSASMGLPAAGDEGPSRWERALAVAERLVSTLGRDFDVRIHPLSNPSAAATPELLRAGGPDCGYTDLAGALVRLEGTMGEADRAVFLVSDGRRTRGGDPSAWAAFSGVPVHCVPVGRPMRATDLVVDSVEGPDKAFVGDEVEYVVRGRLVRWSDRGGASEGERRLVKVELLEEGGRGGSVAVAPPTAQRGAWRAVLRFTAARAGTRFLQVRASVPGEPPALWGNDVAWAALRVRREPGRVLLLGCRPGPEFAFLRRLLDADRAVALTARCAALRARPLQPRPQELDGVRLVMIHGWGGGLPPSFCSRLVERFSSGALSIVLCGMDAEDIEAVSASPLGKLGLSAGVSRWSVAGRDRLHRAFGSKVGTAGGDGPGGRVPLLPDPLYQLHPFFSTDAALVSPLSAWRTAPPLLPSARIRPGPRAVVLARFGGAPALLMSGSSRSFALLLATASTWTWRMLSAAFGLADYFSIFWSNVLRCALDDESRYGVRFEPGPLVVRRGEPRTLTLFSVGRRSLGGRWRVVVESPRGGGCVLPLNGEGEKDVCVASAAWTPSTTGEHVLRLEGPGGETIRRRVMVVPRYEEYRNPAPDRECLASIARASGGMVIESADQVASLPLDRRAIVRRSVSMRDRLDSPVVLGAILLLLSCSWFLRRRAGLP